MSGTPLVSVLLPSFNAASTLEEAFESLARQTLTDFEVVVVNDGSTDTSETLIQAWTKRDSRFRVIHQPHQGILQALNTGWKACRGVYIARMDADDRCAPERLERQVDYLTAHPEAAVVGSLVKGFPAQAVREGFRLYLEWQNSLVEDADIRREMFIESPLAHPSVMLHREWLDRVGGYQEHGWPEDYDLWLRLNQAGARFGKVQQLLLEWREDPQRMTRRDSRYSVENFLRAKAFYLARGPAKDKQAVFLWGAGMMGRRLSKHLMRHSLPLVAFFDIDPQKIGRTRRGLPILPPEQLLPCWSQVQNPILLVAVGARGARPLLRSRLAQAGLIEGEHWWFTA